MDLFVSTRCPQCGADICFEEESTVIRCRYCDSSLHVTGRSGVIRTYVEPRQDVVRMKNALRGALKETGEGAWLVSEKKLFYAPYWRLKAMVFRWMFGNDYQGRMVKQLKTKHLDQTFPAYKKMNLGMPSLGIRPGALKLRVFDRSRMSESGVVMKVALAFEEAKRQVRSSMRFGLDETGICMHLESTRLVAERYSVVYFPFWIITVSLGRTKRIVVVDAAANTVTRVLSRDEWVAMAGRAEKQPASESFKQVSFIPFKCPNCGWDLPMHRFNVIHLCATCRQAWLERGGRFRPVAFEVAAPCNGNGQSMVYLPFWVFQAEITSEAHILKTVGDLHLFSLMFPTRPPQPADKTPLRFFIPAAEIRDIAAANTLATNVTNIQPAPNYMPKETLGSCTLSGAFLSPAAAKEMAYVLLCSLTPKNNRKRQDFVRVAGISISKMRLLWWPFYEQRLFLRDALCGCGIQKGTVTLQY